MCSKAFDRAKKSHTKQTGAGPVIKRECRVLGGHMLWCRTVLVASWWEQKGWCITGAETPDSQTLRKPANCEDVAKDLQSDDSDPKQMADLLQCNQGGKDDVRSHHTAQLIVLSMWKIDIENVSLTSKPCISPSFETSKWSWWMLCWTGSSPCSSVTDAAVLRMISPGGCNKYISAFPIYWICADTAVWIHNLEDCASVICFSSFFSPSRAGKFNAFWAAVVAWIQMVANCHLRISKTVVQLLDYGLSEKMPAVALRQLKINQEIITGLCMSEWNNFLKSPMRIFTIIPITPMMEMSYNQLFFNSILPFSCAESILISKWFPVLAEDINLILFRLQHHISARNIAKDNGVKIGPLTHTSC